jgi:hypothetical protein
MIPPFQRSPSFLQMRRIITSQIKNPHSPNNPIHHDSIYVTPCRNPVRLVNCYHGPNQVAVKTAMMRIKKGSRTNPLFLGQM